MLVSGATLSFNYTERSSAPKLAVGTVDAGDTIKVAVGGVCPRCWPNSNEVVLTSSNGAFANKTVELVTVDKPEWAESVNVVGGEIVLNLKPKATTIIVR